MNNLNAMKIKLQLKRWEMERRIEKIVNYETFNRLGLYHRNEELDFLTLIDQAGHRILYREINNE